MGKHRQQKHKRRLSEPKIKHPESLKVLDSFTDVDLRIWKRSSQDLISFQYRYYYALEAQRAERHEDLCEALRSSSKETISINGWARAVSYEYSFEPLSAKGSRLWVGQRFNVGERVDPTRFPPFSALYIAEDLETTLREKFSLSKNENISGLTREELALIPNESFTTVSVNGTIHNVFDLTNLRSLHKFVNIIREFHIPKEILQLGKKLGLKKVGLLQTTNQLSKSLMEQEWRQWPTLHDIPSNSQVFGSILKDAGYEAVLYRSSKGNGKCLAIFPESLENSESYLELAGKIPIQVKHQRLDSSSWRDLV